MFEEKNYLVIVSVSNEREARFALMRTRIEAAEYVYKLKKYVEEKNIATIVAKIFDMGEPVEVIK